MQSLLVKFAALYAATFIMMTGIGLQNTFLSVRLAMAGFSDQVTGMVLTFYFIGMAAGSFVCGRVIRAAGHIRAFTVFVAFTTAMTMLHGLHFSAAGWAVFRCISGMAILGLYMVVESWLNECTSKEMRGRVFSFYMITAYLGAVIGQSLLNFNTLESPSLFFMIGLLIVLSIVPVALTRSIHPRLPEVEQWSIKELFKKTPVGMMGCFNSGLLAGAFYSMGPVYGLQLELNTVKISMFMAVAIIGGLLMQMPVGKVSDRFDRSKVLLTLSLGTCVVSLLMIEAGRHPFPVLLATAGVFGGVLFTIYPVAVARAHDLFKPDEVVQVSMALFLSFSIGAVVGPMAVSVCMEVWGGYYGFPVYFFIISLLYSGITVFLRKKEMIPVIPVEEQVPAKIMKSTSAIVMHMDPRAGTETGEGKDS